MQQFCIVIPVYKEELNCIEKISLNRLYETIGDKNYKVYLVTPENLDVTVYQEIFNNKLLVETFDPKYFKSTSTYSQLCINVNFYNRFAQYEYMLIYQLDCYLFKDEISTWCDKGYDYIGGPILSTDCGWDTVKKSQGNKWNPFVGNGGFSLRKISTFIDICDPNGELRTHHPELSDEYLLNVIYEDKYFCNDLFNFYYLNVPKWQEAINFGMDMSVDIIYNYMHHDGFPMGAHSIDKNIRYWKNVIPELKDQNIIDFCEEKHKEFFKLYYDENDSSLRQNV